MQESRNSIANELQLRFLALTHRNRNHGWLLGRTPFSFLITQRKLHNQIHLPSSIKIARSVFSHSKGQMYSSIHTSSEWMNWEPGDLCFIHFTPPQSLVVMKTDVPWRGWVKTEISWFVYDVRRSTHHAELMFLNNRDVFWMIMWLFFSVWLTGLGKQNQVSHNRQPAWKSNPHFVPKSW